MAGQAEKRGLPPELPLMASLVESGMKNLNFGDADSVGFFQMRVGIWNQGEYAGYPDKPELQVKWFLDTAEQVKKQRVAAGKPIDDPNSFGEWIADVERPAEQYRYRYQEKLAEAQDLLSRRPAVAPAPAGVVDVAAAVAPAGGGGSSLGAAALAHAETQQGVKETGGANRGVEVEQYLASAKVAPGNPWCASFVTWSLEQAGHKMPGGGWAAVQTWVRNAEQGNNGLQIVSAEDARPGDIVAYDWGGQNDFGSDGHIGFLKSDVNADGKFTALEGNNNDRVGDVPRSTKGANVVFIRINGDAPAGAAPPVDPTAASGAPPAAASQPIDPKQFGGEGTGTGGPPNAEALALLDNKNIVLDETGIADIKAGPDRPARDRRADQAQPGARDQGLVHVLGPLEVHRGRLGLQPLLRPRRRHRGDRRRDRRAGQRDRARGGERALVAGPEHPPERDRLAVGDLRSRLLHRRRPPEPPPPRLQAGDHRRTGSRPRTSPRRAPPLRRRRSPPFRARPSRRLPRRRRRAESSQLFLKAVTAEAAEAAAKKKPQRVAAVPEGRRGAEAGGGRRRAGRSGRRARGAGRRRRRCRRARRRARPMRIRATTRRRSRSPPGWPGRRRSAASRRSCR